MAAILEQPVDLGQAEQKRPRTDAVADLPGSDDRAELSPSVGAADLQCGVAFPGETVPLGS